MKEKNELAFAVLSDHDNRVARQFGLVYSLEGLLRGLFEGFGLDLAAHNGTERWELPMPGTFVVDRQGRVRFAFAKADYTTRAEPDDVLEVLRAL